ncbi:MAG TPA: hypothetical protein VMM76_15730 [Pirellulaceae bacterium]|nr:hypothetical protein [Pirellulaceae bacterium]
MKLFPWRNLASTMDDVRLILLVFVGPLVAIGILHWWLLPKMLGPRHGRAISWKQWLLLGLIVTSACCSSIVGYATYISFARKFDWDQVTQVSALPIALVIAATIFTAAGYFWLRMLDYELRTALGSSNALTPRCRSTMA